MVWGLGFGVQGAGFRGFTDATVRVLARRGESSTDTAGSARTYLGFGGEDFDVSGF